MNSRSFKVTDISKNWLYLHPFY